MKRWWFAAVLLICMLVAIPAAAAKEVTLETSFTPCEIDGDPVATPIPSEQFADWRAFNAAGFVSRSFEWRGFRLTGPLYVQVVALQAREGTDPSALMADVTESVSRIRPTDASSVDFSRIEVRQIGAETAAFAGTVTFPEGAFVLNEAAFGFLISRTGDVVRVFFAYGMTTEIFPELQEVAGKVIARKVGGLVDCNSDGLHTGGLWGLLPTLADMSPGYALVDEG
jgi:hypothetical protein